ncbi:hypothetical protein GU926_17210 [Nibribacter ruber]|uniref:Uncharacterized protein n=1 Tax=Nibribacter ruber TaxID=2698458 RepID=A0A6P1P3U8_9BACT|nr:hypothetical protein [Nibribacter ruber]QHL89072.1 hypothetical protein GU926_17210 [Nibribacter ruber]
MKIKSLLSLVVCGVASQFMIGCSSGQYFDYTVASKPAYTKVAPQENLITVAQTEETSQPATAPVAPVAPALEASAATATRSASVARTAPLTTAAVERAAASNTTANALASEMAAAKSAKEVKAVVKKMKREAKESKRRLALNQYVKIGLILLIAGLLFSAVVSGPVGAIVAIVGLVFILLGVLEM